MPIPVQNAVVPAALSGPIARQSEPGAPYINSWLLLGTFENDAQNSGYERAFIDESQLAPQAGLVSAGQNWRYFDDRLFSRNYDDYNDLYSYYRVKQDQSVVAKVVYAHSYVHSARAQSVQLRLGADTSVKAWVNGATVLASTTSTPASSILDPSRAHLNSGRDYVVAQVSLEAGWNRLLLKVANREAGRFGFYARLTTSAGETVPGLTYSTGGAAGELAISTSAMSEAKSGALPTAYREWSYVGAKPDVETLTKMGQAQSGPEGQKPPIIQTIFGVSQFNKGLSMQSSPFALLAQGGSAPYRWSLAKGKLPAGLQLMADGTLQGTPTAGAAFGDYPFTVQVQDAAGKSVQKAFTLPLKQRPNRWMEEMRLTGLIHGPERISKEDVPKVAKLMKRQGYGLGFPISYNNGDLLFRWPAPLGTKKTEEDWDSIYKTALEKEGVQFGMYMGNLNVENDPNFNVNQQILVVEDAIRRYQPKAFWFDWLGLDGTSLDSLFSMIRSYDPEALIVLNGTGRIFNGDWDVICYEGWGGWGNAAWSTWPANFPWPKKHSPESWRLSVQPEWELSGGITSKWDEMLRIQLSMIGEGFIADMDHSSFLGTVQTTAFQDLPLVKLHSEMGDWANPKSLPPLTEAYTMVDAGPLDEAMWGYNTINLKRDAIYLIALENPRGKVGLPKTGELPLGPVEGQIKSITLMNTGAKIPFTMSATKKGFVTVDIRGVKADPVATILKVELQKPLTATQVSRSRATIPKVALNKMVPDGNLASYKPAWLMSADGKRELVPSGTQFAVNGNDGNIDTSAAAGGEYAWSYKVDLKSVYSIRRIAAHFNLKGWATEFRIWTSLDGAEWKILVPDTGGKPGENLFQFEPTPTRFLRVESIKPDGPNQVGGQMSITELQVFEN